MMLQVLDDLSSLTNEDQNFSEFLETLPFVPVSETALVSAEDLKSPTEILDPEVKLISELFTEKEKVFPVGRFAEKNYLVTLRKLGMKTKLVFELFLERARGVPELSDTGMTTRGARGARARGSQGS
jgi:hypothetical protein